MDKNITEKNTANQPPPIKAAFNWRHFRLTSKPIDLKINWFKAAKYIYPITIIIIIIVLIWFMSFLYDNVYATMSQAVELSGLKSKVAEERLNLKEFDQIIKRIKDKNNLLNWTGSPPLITPFALGNKKPIKSTSTSATSTPAIKTTSTPTSTPKKI